MTSDQPSLTDAASVWSRSLRTAFVAGAGIGVLGGMIGLGGAEFRLPLLIGIFGFIALQAVILNKAMSLIVVITALPARLASIPFDELAPHWFIVVNLLTGSLIGAWIGATWATKMRSATLYKVLAVLLVLIAAALAFTHLGGQVNTLDLSPGLRTVLGVAAGVAIGIVAALMGVAGGELLIPTIVLLYAIDIKVAGSLSLTVSLPTMLVAFARYSRDNNFQALRDNKAFVIAMAAGSITGTLLGASSSASSPAWSSSQYSRCCCSPQPSKSGATTKPAQQPRNNLPVAQAGSNQTVTRSSVRLTRPAGK